MTATYAPTDVVKALPPPIDAAVLPRLDRRGLRIDRRGLRIDARRVQVSTKAGAALLRGISLSIRPGELVAILGPSGAGKTTLLDTLAGIRPATSGEVRLSRDRDRTAVKSRKLIGYVPQDDIINTELSLRRTLQHAARLRLPVGSSARQRKAAVRNVLRDLHLGPQAETRVTQLSGGQRKRCSIAVELLTNPRALLLDEPTSGLDPVNDRHVFQLLRHLADSGTTVVMTTHTTANVGMCDRVIVLATGGELAFVGTVPATLEHFGVRGLDEIYERLASPELATAAAQRWRATRPPDDVPSSRPRVNFQRANRSSRRRRKSPLRVGWHQLRVLSRRNAEIHFAGKQRIAPLVAQPIVLSILLMILFNRGVFDAGQENPTAALQLIFILTFNAFLLGLLTSVQEIVKERAIFNREQMVGVSARAYVLSKVTFQAPAMAAGVTLMVAVLKVAGRLPADGASTYIPLLTSLVLTGLAGMALGLLTSSVVSSTQQATDVLPLWITPQVLFSGALITIAAMNVAGRALSNLAPVRWGLECTGHAAGLLDVFRNSNNLVGASLLRQYGTTFDQGPKVAWTVLSAFTVIGLLLTCRVLGRRQPKGKPSCANTQPRPAAATTARPSSSAPASAD